MRQKWEKYQSLPPETRRELALRPPPPPGAPANGAARTALAPRRNRLGPAADPPASR